MEAKPFYKQGEKDGGKLFYKQGEKGGGKMFLKVS